MNKTFLVLALVFCSVLCFSQEKFTISGTVSDFETGEIVIGASIVIKELLGVGATSNTYGYYSLSVPKGIVTIEVSFIGYEKIIKPINLNENKKLDFKLKTNAEILGEIEITTEKANSNIVSDRIGIDKMSTQEVKKIPILFGQPDVVKTLTLMPGVKMLGEGGGGMFVRGGNHSQNLVLLDEATVYNATHLLGFFSTFNSDAIKDLTLYKGTAPAEYGGRISSVMDIIMNDGNNQKFRIGGGIGLISSNLSVEGPIVKDKGSFLITGRRTYADLFLKLSPEELLNNNQLYFYDLNIKANYRINENNRVFISGYFGRDVMRFQDRFGLNWGNSTLTLRWNKIWNSKLFSNTSLIYSNYDYKVSIPQDVVGYDITSIIKNWNLIHEFQFFANDKNTLTFGFNTQCHNVTPGKVDATENSSLNPVKLQDRYGLESGLFISNNWKPSGVFRVNYGLRLSIFNLLGPGDFYSYWNGEVTDIANYKSGKIVKTYVNLEPRLNLTYILDETASIKASFTRNTQNLHLVQNSSSSSPTDIWIMSSKNVKPEIGDQVAFGYFKNFKQDSYQFSGEVYYRSMKNQMDLKNGAEVRANEYIEGELLFGLGRAYGLELMLKKKQGKLSGWISYTISRIERQIEGISNSKWYPARQDANHDISIVAIYDLNKKWTFSATWVYNTGNAITFPSGKYEIDGQVKYYYTERNGYRMPDYHRLDLGATRTFKKTDRFESSLSFSLFNAYGHKNAYSIDFQQDSNNPSKTIAVKTYLFTFVPSVTYTFKF